MTEEAISSAALVHTTLDMLLDVGDSTAKPITILRGYNLGNTTLITTLPLGEFLTMSGVANERGISENRLFEGEPIAQRKLDPAHASKLAQYMLKGMVHDLLQRYEQAGETPSPELSEIASYMGAQPYFALQPVVANVRTAGKGGRNLRADKIDGRTVQVYLGHRDVLWVVDGQHRRYAVSLLIDYLQSIQTKHLFLRRPALYGKAHDQELTPAELRAWTELFQFMRTDCTIAIEVHLGLDENEERQLFHDLNNLGKKVDAELAFDFDNANAINVYIKHHLGSVLFSHKDLIGINALLFLNKTKVSGANPANVQARMQFADRFWSVVQALDGFNKKGANVLSQAVVLKALAKLVYDMAWSKNADWTELETLFTELPKMNFDFDNPAWRYYEMTDTQRNKAKIGRLSAYLPAPPRDLGKWNEADESFKFSPRHNDIYPIIGDIVRWTLGLKKRQDAK